MRWDRITKAWAQIVARMNPSWSSTPEVRSNHAGVNHVGSFAGGFYKEPGMTPYRPENHVERGNSSQHLSC